MPQSAETAPARRSKRKLRKKRSTGARKVPYSARPRLGMNPIHLRCAPTALLLASALATTQVFEPVPAAQYRAVISFTISGVSATRSYVYDTNQRLCKTLEPESGATVQAYDTASNIAWRASGLSLPSTGACDQASVPAARQIGYGYDLRNRLTSTSYGDGSAGITRSWTADGLPYQVTSAGSTWTYGYNNRRLLTSETLAHSTGTYGFTWGIEAHGNVASLAYPGGSSVAYSPNALGEPTAVSGHASGVSYHPNGAIAGYTLGNGVVHSTTQNARGLPLVWRDAGVVQDLYAFDANGNVASITDQQEGLTHRSLGYDGLDRLTAASGIWGAGSFGYDGLDNLRTSTLGSRSTVATIDAANRLSVLTVNGVAQNFGYDANGNLTSRGTQGFSFDIGNRLASAPGKASYAYDGHGRRTWVAYADGSWKLQVYGQGGKLLYTNHSSQGNTRHVYLGSRLIAEVNSVSGASYSHTDALGSPVAKTNGSAQLINRTRYEPYGATAAGTNPTGIGFTGHVNDADTGLVYMQQRYYDPIAGRFLSVDPVTTDAKTGSSFNRYAYGNNNPYKYVDPDGRNPLLGIAVGIGVEVFKQMVIEGKSFGELDKTDIVVADAIGAIFPGAVKGLSEVGKAGPGVAKNMAAISKLQGQAANTPNRAGKILAGIEKNVTEAAKKVGDAGSTAALAATGVSAKGAVQEVVNNRQEASSSSGSNSANNPARVDPPPEDKPR